MYIFNTMNADKEAHLSSCIRGYHVYDAVWNTTVGEKLQVGNVKGIYAVSILWSLDLIDTCLSCDKHHMDLIAVKESNGKSKVHTVKSCYMVNELSWRIIVFTDRLLDEVCTCILHLWRHIKMYKLLHAIKQCKKFKLFTFAYTAILSYQNKINLVCGLHAWF